MNVLIADDDTATSHLLGAALEKWGYQAILVDNGKDAWKILQQQDAPKLVILDWVMPEMDGVEICRDIRALGHAQPPYIILVTGNSSIRDTVLGLEAGADDYITKPFDRAELRARLQVGCRIVQLQSRLAERVRQLQDSLSQVKQLQGLLPICSYCKKIRDDGNYWQQVERYICDHTDAKFSHGICPDCYKSEVEPQLIAAGVNPATVDDFLNKR